MIKMATNWKLIFVVFPLFLSEINCCESPRSCNDAITYFGTIYHARIESLIKQVPEDTFCSVTAQGTFANRYGMTYFCCLYVMFACYASIIISIHSCRPRCLSRSVKPFSITTSSNLTLATPRFTTPWGRTASLAG